MILDCGLISNSSPVRRDRFSALHRDGKRLIRNWATRGAKVTMQNRPSSDFEGFIYLWFALNGWGACVADTDTDREWVDAVAGDHELSDKFIRLLDADPDFRDAVSSFAGLWPIFRSSEIRRRQVRVPIGCGRRERVQAYLDNNLRGFQPSCWERHGGEPPDDWPHTLKTIYRVRCNLFHGEKTLDSENDRVIVQGAYDVLALFIEGTKLLA